MSDHTKRPNLYTYATSELSQDATIAYLLAWADEKYQGEYSEMHRLGKDLLMVFIEKWNQRKNEQPDGTTGNEVAIFRDCILKREDIKKLKFVVSNDIST